MRKKLLSLSCALLLMAGLLGISASQVQAEDRPMIDGSYLIQEEASIGYDTKITRGGGSADRIFQVGTAGAWTFICGRKHHCGSYRG